MERKRSRSTGTQYAFVSLAKDGLARDIRWLSCNSTKEVLSKIGLSADRNLSLRRALFFLERKKFQDMYIYRYNALFFIFLYFQLHIKTICDACEYMVSYVSFYKKQLLFLQLKRIHSTDMCSSIFLFLPLSVRIIFPISSFYQSHHVFKELR